MITVTATGETLADCLNNLQLYVKFEGLCEEPDCTSKICCTKEMEDKLETVAKKLEAMSEDVEALVNWFNENMTAQDIRTLPPDPRDVFPNLVAVDKIVSELLQIV